MAFHNLMDSIAWGTLGFFALLEIAIWGGAFLYGHRDPYQQRIAQKRAELELAKQQKARKAWADVAQQRAR